MHTIVPSPLLKSVLLLDAVVGGLTALLQLSASSWLATLLELPRLLLVDSGLLLMGYMLLLSVLANLARVSAGWIWLVVLGNISWAVGCVAILATGAVATNALGAGFIALHVLTVLTFASLELVGLKGSERAVNSHVLHG